MRGSFSSLRMTTKNKQPQRPKQILRFAKDDKRWVGTPGGERDFALELPAEEGGGCGEACAYAGKEDQVTLL
jgi:hypothetical protein